MLKVNDFVVLAGISVEHTPVIQHDRVRAGFDSQAGRSFLLLRAASVNRQ